MSLPDVQFRAVRDITDEEVEELYNLVLRYKPLKIIEIGTYGGFATVYLAAALKYLGMGSLISIDYNHGIMPPVERSLAMNNLSEVVKLITVQNYESIQIAINRHMSDVNMIYIDGIHDKGADFWSYLSEHLTTKCIIVFHDVLCEESDTMQIPALFKTVKKLYESTTINTLDKNGAPNGIGIIEYVPKEDMGQERSKIIESVEGIMDKEVEKAVVKSLDPSLRVRRPRDKVKCGICGKMFKQLTETHMKRAHNITLDEYKEKYETKITPEEEIEKEVIDPKIVITTNNEPSQKDKQ